jgi:hypothetical protein
MSTGVAASAGGGVNARATEGTIALAIGRSPVKAIVMSSSTLRYSTLP